jgi:Holliday junction DNA helicase RuvA
MIASIRGKITDIGNRYIVVEAGNIGYKVYVTDDTLHLIQLGKDVFLWTHLAVREDSQDLYGFMSKKERDFFGLLINISGIGPKTALNILSLVPDDALISAAKTGSIAHLVKVSGIGRKTAEKIVMELRDKLDAFESSSSDAGMLSDSDTIEALKSLGYDIDDAREALKNIDKNISDTGDKVKAALKILGK